MKLGGLCPDRPFIIFDLKNVYQSRAYCFISPFQTIAMYLAEFCLLKGPQQTGSGGPWLLKLMIQKERSNT